MAEGIAHIAIAVKDLEAAKLVFSKLLGVSPRHEEEVAGQKVKTAMFRVGDVDIELLEGTAPDSPVSTFIARRGEGIHHISLEVANVAEEMARLRKEGFELVDERPQPGANDSLVAFLHPRSTNGVLIEIGEHTRQRRR